jgi:tol-pal system protein YbgF
MNRAMSRGAAPALLLALVAGPGCYGTRLASLEVRTARIEEKVEGLDRANGRLAAAVDTLQDLVRADLDEARSTRAESEARLHQIQDLLQVLSTRVDESGQQYRELKDVFQYSKTARDSSGAPAVTPRALYDAAYQDLTRGNHGLAIMGFQEVIAKFPASELADNSQYWIGESYYAQKDYKHAQAEFQKTVDVYPQGDKVPAALLKIALCQIESGDKKAGRATLEKLTQRFPQSEEARLAKTKLQDL